MVSFALVVFRELEERPLARPLLLPLGRVGLVRGFESPVYLRRDRLPPWRALDLELLALEVGRRDSP